MARGRDSAVDSAACATCRSWPTSATAVTSSEHLQSRGTAVRRPARRRLGSRSRDRGRRRRWANRRLRAPALSPAVPRRRPAGRSGAAAAAEDAAGTVAAAAGRTERPPVRPHRDDRRPDPSNRAPPPTSHRRLCSSATEPRRRPQLSPTPTSDGQALTNTLLTGSLTKDANEASWA